MGSPLIDLSRFKGTQEPEKKIKPLVDLSHLQTPQPEIVPPDDHDDSWGIGNMFAYMRNISPQLGQKLLESSIFSPIVQMNKTAAERAASRQYVMDTANALVRNVGKFVGEDWSPIPKGGIGNAIKEGMNPKGIVKGLAGLATAPIEALTATKNVDGTPKPATAEEQAQSIQKVAGMAIQGVVTSKIMGALAPKLVGEASLAPSKMGVLGRSIAADVAANAVGGGALGLVENMGQDDMATKAISSALAMAPLGVLFGKLHASKTLKNAELERARFIQEGIPQTAQELAATKGLQITTQDSMDDVLAKTDAVAKNDAQVHALVSSNLDVGKGTIIKDLTDLQKQKLEGVLSPTGRVNEGVYVPDKSIIGKIAFMVGQANKAEGMGKIIPQFKDTFDKAVWFSGSKSKNAKLILDDIIDKTNLTEDEILSHRAALKEFIKKSPTEPGQTVLEVPKLNFNGQYGRTPYKYTLYTHEPTKTTFVAAEKLNKPTQEFFEKTGFMPGEVVFHNGVENIVVEASSVGETLSKVALRVKKEPTKIFEGPLEEGHRGIFNKNIEEGRNYAIHEMDEGFITSTGRFVNRKEALTVARDRGILKKDPESWYSADELAAEELDLTMTKEGNIRLQNATTRKYWSAKPEELIRSNQNLSSEMWKESNGNEVGRLGILNRENYFNTLYEKFKQKFILDEVPNESYAESINKFAEEMGIRDKGDIANIQRGFYGKIQKDVMNHTDFTGDFEGVVRVKKQLEDWNNRFNEDFGSKLSQTAMGNGMYIIPKGKGMYEIKSITDQQVLAQVRTPEDALDFMQRSGATNAWDYDGGNTGGVPPSAANLGSLADPHFFREEPGFGKLDKQFRDWWDTRFNAGGFSTAVVPAQRNLAAMDGISQTDFLTHHNAMQRVSGILRTVTQARLKKIEDSYNHAVKLMNKLSKDGVLDKKKMAHITDAMELKGADREEYSNLVKLTGKEKELVNRLDVLFNGIQDQFKYTPEQYEKISVDKVGVLRHPLIIARNLIYDGTRNMPVVKDVDAYPGLAKRNPSTGQWFSKDTGAPYEPKMLSFNDITANADNYAGQLLRDIKTRKDGDIVQSHVEVFNNHIADVKGIPDFTQGLADAAKEYMQNLHGVKALLSGDGFKALTLLTHSALLGGRLGLTFRDIANAHANAYSLYGSKFALKIMGVGVPKEYIMHLNQSGEIHFQNGLDLMLPGETPSTAMTRLEKTANSAMKYNGNVLTHMQMTAGIYKATMDHVGELSSKMVKNEVSKAAAYKELKIQTLEPTTRQMFEDYISAGNTVGAAKLLARYRVKQIVNIFGNNNNPIGWGTAWGRVAGGMMSWGVNQVQTMGDGLLRGSRMDRGAFVMRMTASNAALATAGYLTGLNLNSWLVDPMQLVGISPLLSAGQNTIHALANIHNPNINARGQAQNEIKTWFPHDDKTIAHMYIPYSYMMQDFVDTYKMSQSDFGLSTGVRWMGIKPVDSRSPLQEEMGNYPYIEGEGQYGQRTIKRLPSKNQTPLERKVLK